VSLFHKDKEQHEALSPQQNNPGTEDQFTDINELAAQEVAIASGTGEMEEIYSTRDKHVKYKRLTPIEAEAAAKRQAATKHELIAGKLEFSSAAEPVAPDVELKAEQDPHAVIAEDIIEDIHDVRSLRGIYVRDIDEIDISLDPMDNLREYERTANDKERYEARRDGADHPYVHFGEKIVSTVPVYQHESKVDKLYLKAGRFTDVVESEYDEYLKSTDPTISKNYHTMQKEIKPKQSLLYTLSQMAQKRKEEAEQQKADETMRENFDEEIAPPEKKTSNVGKFFRIAGTLVTDSFIKPADPDERSTDYNSREDEKYMFNKLRKNLKKLGIHTAVFSLTFIASLVLNIMERSGVFSAAIAPLYCGINLLLMIAIGIVGRRYIVDGILPLRRFKGNCDTAPALAYCACLIQCIVAIFTSASFVNGENHLYVFIISFALLLNTIGRLTMTIRVRRNFKFITSHSPAYAAKIYNDEETASRMVSGTTASKGVVAYQHITRFLSDFFKISYAPDPSEEVSSKITPFTLLISVFVTVMYSIIFKSVTGSVSALTVMLCIGTPFTALLAGNLPMAAFSHRMLREGAMVAGYPSVKQFCDTSAVMLNAYELFPKGSVKLHDIVSFQQFRVEDNLLMAAAVLRDAMSPIAPVFDELVAENDHVLPSVESVLYEEKSGLVGWINGERILIGNMALMNRYHISIPDEGPASHYRSRGREVTYIARSGQAVAVMALSYSAPLSAQKQMQKAESSGLAFIVSTPDPNITAEMVAEQYGLFYRSVKIMSPGYANEIDEVTSKAEESSRAYLATRGRQSALARAIGGCIGIKSNITLGIAIGIFGTVLGILLCATLALYASVARLSIVEMLIYILFWTGASLLAALIRRP